MIQVDTLFQPASSSNATSTHVRVASSAQGLTSYDNKGQGGPDPCRLQLPSLPEPDQRQGSVGLNEAGGHVVHWTQSGPSYHNATDCSDDDEDKDYRPFTPPPPRERLSYTRYQLELLNGIYVEVRYPNSVQKQLIAKRVGITREQVKIWFQNRRRKDVVGKATDKRSNSNKNNTVAQSEGESIDTSSISPISPHRGVTGGSSKQHAAHSSSAADLDDALDTDKQSESDGLGRGEKVPDHSDGVGGTTQGDNQQMVPEVVMRSIIAELCRFSDSQIKSKKEKHKSKQKNRHSAAKGSVRTATRTGHGGSGGTSSGPSVNRLFHPYDMVAPPNKVTPTAFLNTAANRFHHSHNTSAFSSPHDLHGLTVAMGMQRLTWDRLGAALTQPGGGSVSGDYSHHHPSVRGFPATAMSSMNMATGFQDSLPVIADILGYRQQVEGNGVAGTAGSRDACDDSQPQPELVGLGGDAADASKMPSFSAAYHGGVMQHAPSLGGNRVFPFPFMAEPPIMLSSLHQHEQLRPYPHWPSSSPPAPPQMSPLVSMSAVDDSYKPVMISSLSNPFFTYTQASSNWTVPPSADSSPSSSFT